MRCMLTESCCYGVPKRVCRQGMTLCLIYLNMTAGLMRTLSAVRINSQLNMVPLIKQIVVLLQDCEKLTVWTTDALNDRPGNTDKVDITCAGCTNTYTGLS